MLYLYPLFAIVFIILVLVARKATRVNPTQYGTMQTMTSVRDRCAQITGANLAQRAHLRSADVELYAFGPGSADSLCTIYVAVESVGRPKS